MPKKNGAQRKFSRKLNQQVTKKQKTTNASPFENILVRSKHTVLGKSQRGKIQRNSEKKAISSRAKSLFAEFHNQGNTNTFKDKRFGEQVESTALDQGTIEERALARFKLEHQRKLAKKLKRKAPDNDDGSQLAFTHGGRALELGSDEEYSDGEDSRMDRGGKLDMNKVMSKRDVMNEIIMKSKLYKMEKKEKKEQQIGLLEQLDTDFGSLRGLLEQKMSVADDGEDGGAETNEKSALGEMDEWMREVKALSYESRHKASDKLQGKNEVALSQLTKLKELEAQRLEALGDNEDTYTVEPLPESASFIEQPGLADKFGKMSLIQNVPTSYAELRSVLAGLDASQQETVLQRMLITSHPSLPQMGMESVSRLVFLLWTHVSTVCTEYNACVDTANEDVYTLVQNTMHVIQRVLFAVGQVAPGVSTLMVQSQMKTLSTRLFDVYDDEEDEEEISVEKVRQMQTGRHLGAYDLFFLQTVTILFPFRTAHESAVIHAVINPLRVLLAQVVVRLPISTGKDMAAVLFVASLIAQGLESQRQFVPELMAFLQALFTQGLGELMTEHAEKFAHFNFYDSFQWRGAQTNVKGWFYSLLKNTDDPAVQTAIGASRIISFRHFFKPSEDVYFQSIELKSASLFAALRILEAVFRVFRTSQSYIELFHPFVEMLSLLKQTMEASAMKTPKGMYTPVEILSSLHGRMSMTLRTQLQERKPLHHDVKATALPSLEPQYDMNYFGKKRLIEEERNLQRKFKREKKGAMHELRKDTQFMARLKATAEKNTEMSQKKRRNEILQMLTEQQRDTNLMRGKTKDRSVKKDRRKKDKKRQGKK